MAFGKNTKYCSFCGSTNKRMIQGPNGVNICESCVERCNEILFDETPRNAAVSAMAMKMAASQIMRVLLIFMCDFSSLKK